MCVCVCVSYHGGMEASGVAHTGKHINSAQIKQPLVRYKKYPIFSFHSGTAPSVQSEIITRTTKEQRVSKHCRCDDSKMPKYQISELALMRTAPIFITMSINLCLWITCYLCKFHCYFFFMIKSIILKCFTSFLILKCDELLLDCISEL